jgi:DNA polymerase kappa
MESDDRGQLPPTEIPPPETKTRRDAFHEGAGREEAHFYHFSHDKAGMGGVDKAKVALVVHECSRGSKFYTNEERRDERLQKRIASLRQRWAQLKPGSPELSFAEATATADRTAMEATRDMSRVWVVVDMDMFFAAVAMRDDPSLRDIPIAVGGMGMISTANYAARQFGVRSAMPGFIAKKLCPQLVFVNPDFSKYKEASRQAREVFRRYDPRCSAVSLDEAYLDITDYLRSRGITFTQGRPATTTESSASRRETVVERGTGMVTARSTAAARLAEAPATELFDADSDSESVHSVEAPEEEAPSMASMTLCIRERPSHGDAPLDRFHQAVWDVVEELRGEVTAKTGGLTCSAGVGPNAMVAKIASDMNKPNGHCIVPFLRDAIVQFMGSLAVRKLPGIGRVQEALLGGLGLNTLGDVQREMSRVRVLFSGKASSWITRACFGIAETQRAESSGHVRKSIGMERTFRDESDLEALVAILDSLVSRVAKHMQGDPVSLHAEGGDDMSVVKQKQHGHHVVGFFGSTDSDDESVPPVPIKGRTVTVKMKLASFAVVQRSVTLEAPTNNPRELQAAATRVLRREVEILRSSDPEVKFRLLGFKVHNLTILEPAEGGISDYFAKQASASKPAPPVMQAAVSKRPRDTCLAHAVKRVKTTDTVEAAPSESVLQAVMRRRLADLKAPKSPAATALDRFVCREKAL